MNSAIFSELNENCFSGSDVRSFEPKFPETTPKPGFGNKRSEMGSRQSAGMVT
jgi:hypothetical protein